MVATVRISETAAKAWLESRKLRVFLNENGLKTVNELIGKANSKVVDFVADADDGGRFVLAEAKETLNSGAINSVLDNGNKFADSIDTLKQAYTVTGERFPGVSELVITATNVKWDKLGPYSIDAAGRLLRDGQRVSVEGIDVTVHIVK